ncbi:hypothetical protein S40285_10542 [Stachybotrys chlorohalonatus IBT 40285]|uniref:Uncharacterized protein n=1 Tax=Stachybotrys chlorohalonatus (strain IBT 40285) TaxID=1283841 RepID=A0A084QH62_STAC4|nr:hypothetical protein S40285_10542 [Stachybotrys chlorohalonata IBT 40285]
MEQSHNQTGKFGGDASLSRPSATSQNDRLTASPAQGDSLTSPRPPSPRSLSNCKASRRIESLARRLSQQSLKDHDETTSSDLAPDSLLSEEMSLIQGINLHIPQQTRELEMRNCERPNPEGIQQPCILGTTSSPWAVSRWLETRLQNNSGDTREPKEGLKPSEPLPQTGQSPHENSSDTVHFSMNEAAPYGSLCPDSTATEELRDLVDGRSLLNLMQPRQHRLSRVHREGRLLPFKTSTDAALQCRDLVYRAPRMRKREKRKRDLHGCGTDVQIDSADVGCTKRVRRTGDSGTGPEDRECASEPNGRIS